MAEYIERGTLLKVLENAEPDIYEDYGDGVIDWGFGRGSIQDMINDILTVADVAPAIHGKWTLGIEECPVCSENKFKNLDAYIWADWQPPFCPNCGVRLNQDWA